MDSNNKTFHPTEHSSLDGGMSIDGSIIEKESPPPNVTFRKGINQTKDTDFRDDFNSFQATVLAMLESWFSKQDVKFTKLLNEFEEVKTSINFMSEKYTDLEKKIEDVDTRVSNLEKNINATHPIESRLLKDLQTKLSVMEQKSRSCNLEISNMPERRGENLLNIVENIADVIKQPLLPRDVIAVHRVPQMQSNTHRPKNIIVKFATQIQRDNFIAATRLRKGISSDELNIQGNAQKIYINEHLTLQNKTLFRQVRESAEQKGIRFVWIKHGVILTRADTASTVIAIRSEADISKLKPYKSNQRPQE